MIEALQTACAEKLPVFPVTGEDIKDMNEDFGIPEGWIAAWILDHSRASAVSLPALLQKAQEKPFCPGVILNPGPEPLYLSADIIELVLDGSAPATSAEAADMVLDKERDPSLKSHMADAEIISSSIRDLIRQGDYFHDPDGDYNIHKAYECYKRAYDLACLEKDLFLYPEICLRLAEHYPDRYSHEDLLALIDEIILYFGIRINAGDDDAPALLVRAQRIREQAAIRQARKMVIHRYIV